MTETDPGQAHNPDTPPREARHDWTDTGGTRWWPAEPCPDSPHRRPQGPNEDMAVCPTCGSPSHEMRPEGETYGLHDPDCSLSVRHESWCVGGGSGHPPAPVIRGYWPDREEEER